MLDYILKTEKNHLASLLQNSYNCVEKKLLR